MSVHGELLTTLASMGFKPPNPSEPDATYLGRLALAANSLPDSEWACLTPEAIEWVNASAKRLNAGKPVESCPGFGDASYIGEYGTLWTPIEKDSLEGMGLAPGGYIDEAGKFVITEMSIVEPGTQLDPHCVIGKAHVPKSIPAENIVVDTGSGDSKSAYFPIDPELMGVSREDHLLGFFNNTDRLRGLVMLHPDWTHADFKAAMGGDVKGATLNTVRSVTLATIAVAKRLGLWRAA